MVHDVFNRPVNILKLVFRGNGGLQHVIIMTLLELVAHLTLKET